jgi:hypothetical protein
MISSKTKLFQDLKSGLQRKSDTKTSSIGMQDRIDKATTIV